MAEQYFTENPDTKRGLRVIDCHLVGIDLKLITDAGVFLKNRVDYGSGVLIHNMSEESPASGSILDVRCDYGPIGLFAAKKQPDRQVDVVDVNGRAVNLARKNAEVNGVTSVNILASSVYENVDKQYAIILTNPPIRTGRNIISEVLERSCEHLLVGGELLVIIQKKRRVPNAKKLMETIFGNCKIVKRDKGCYILRSIKRRTITFSSEGKKHYTGLVFAETKKAEVQDEVSIDAITVDPKG